jgi:hypothetical protein
MYSELNADALAEKIVFYIVGETPDECVRKTPHIAKMLEKWHRPEPPRREAEQDATVQTVINLLTDRPKCPSDLSESGKYEFLIETAVELLRGITPAKGKEK